jgi:hypothetical protein
MVNHELYFGVGVNFEDAELFQVGADAQDSHEVVVSLLDGEELLFEEVSVVFIKIPGFGCVN